MYIIPAIDIIDGKCVRLVQGEYQRKIVYNDDPLDQAQQFIDAGANWLHVVDLEGAKVGQPVNLQTIQNIVNSKDINVEVGGGIRNEDYITRLLDIGVKRVIIGTKAVSDFEWFSKMAEKYPGKLVLGLDARGSKVATHGWTQDSPQSLFDFAEKADKLPLAAIIYTDITKDGMLSGPNIERTKKLAESVSIPVIASGGINSIEDVSNLIEAGSIAAAITGRALYEETLDLKEAVELTKK